MELALLRPVARGGGILRRRGPWTDTPCDGILDEMIGTANWKLGSGNSELETGNWRLETFLMDALKSKIRHVPDFPKAGILFYDITTLLRDPAGFRLAIDSVATPFQDKSVSLVVGIESRGFILGAAVADRIGAGFVPVR